MIGRQASAPSHPSLPSRPENSTADHAESSKRIAPRVAIYEFSQKMFAISHEFAEFRERTQQKDCASFFKL